MIYKRKLSSHIHDSMDDSHQFAMQAQKLAAWHCVLASTFGCTSLQLCLQSRAISSKMVALCEIRTKLPKILLANTQWKCCHIWRCICFVNQLFSKNFCARSSMCRWYMRDDLARSFIIDDPCWMIQDRSSMGDYGWEIIWAEMISMAEKRLSQIIFAQIISHRWSRWDDLFYDRSSRRDHLACIIYT